MRVHPGSRSMQGKRLERVNQLIKEEISLLLQRELKDPRLGFVTVTEVETTADLRAGQGVRVGARRRGAVGLLVQGARERAGLRVGLAPASPRPAGDAGAVVPARPLDGARRPDAGAPGRAPAERASAARRADDEREPGRRRGRATPRSRGRALARDAAGCCCSATCIPTPTCSARCSRSASRWSAPAGLRRSPVRIRCPTCCASCPGPAATRSGDGARAVPGDRADGLPEPGRTEGLLEAGAGPAGRRCFNIDHHPDNRRYGTRQLDRSRRRGHRRDGPRAPPRARAAGDRGHRAQPVHGDPHRHRVVPVLEHDGADVPHRRRAHAGRGRARRWCPTGSTSGGRRAPPPARRGAAPAWR